MAHRIIYLLLFIPYHVIAQAASEGAYPIRRRPQGGGSSAVMMSDTMARNTMIVIGVAAFIVFLYGVKYWRKKR